MDMLAVFFVFAFLVCPICSRSSEGLAVELATSGETAKVEEAMSTFETPALDSQACREGNIRRRRRDEKMCSCRRRSSNNDLPSGYTCSGDSGDSRDRIEKENRARTEVAVNASSNHGTKCDHCYGIIAEFWEERSVCFLKCGESVYFPQRLGLYSTITSKYEKIGIYQIRLDEETNWIKKKIFEYKYVARTNRNKVLIRFFDAEPDDYLLTCPVRDCDPEYGRASCRDASDEHSVSFKIDGVQKPLLEGFEVTWP